VNPFVGYTGGLSTGFTKKPEVISLAYMSHPGAYEGYGLELRNGGSFDLMLERANSWESDGVIMGTTRTDKIRIA
jgi:hypothetical protein